MTALLDRVPNHQPAISGAAETRYPGDLDSPLTAKKRIAKNRIDAHKLQKRLRRNVGEAVQDFRMIEAGDRVVVCLSGGKDSYTLLDILMSLRRSAPVDFEIHAVNLDQKQPGFPEHVLPDYLATLGIPFRVIEQDTYRVVRRVVADGKTQCGLCSRLRRGALYRFAREHGMTKIALGHHRDDIVETFFLNLFFGGRLKAMPPQAPERRWAARRHPAARLLHRAGHRGLCHDARLPPRPLYAVRLTAQPPAGRDQANAA